MNPKFRQRGMALQPVIQHGQRFGTPAKRGQTIGRAPDCQRRLPVKQQRLLGGGQPRGIVLHVVTRGTQVFPSHQTSGVNRQRRAVGVRGLGQPSCLLEHDAHGIRNLRIGRLQLLRQTQTVEPHIHIPRARLQVAEQKKHLTVGRIERQQTAVNRLSTGQIAPLMALPRRQKTLVENRVGIFKHLFYLPFTSHKPAKAGTSRRFWYSPAINCIQP